MSLSRRGGGTVLLFATSFNGQCLLGSLFGETFSFLPTISGGACRDLVFPLAGHVQALFRCLARGLELCLDVTASLTVSVRPSGCSLDCLPIVYLSISPTCGLCSVAGEVPQALRCLLSVALWSHL